MLASPDRTAVTVLGTWGQIHEAEPTQSPKDSKVLLRTVPCVECKYCTGKTQGYFWEVHRLCQTLLSMCLLFPQEESVCSMHSQSRLTSLVSMLQSDSLSDGSICSSRVSPWGSPLPPVESRNGPSEFSIPAWPAAQRTVSLAWRIQLSHCCLLKVSLAWSEWVWLWAPFLKLTRKKFLTRNEKAHMEEKGQ